MTTWTKMKINKMIEFSTNSIRTTVTVRSPYGSYTDSVSNIRMKLQDNDLLPVVRKMFEDMLKYWENDK